MVQPRFRRGNVYYLPDLRPRRRRMAMADRKSVEIRRNEVVPVTIPMSGALWESLQYASTYTDADPETLAHDFAHDFCEFCADVRLDPNEWNRHDMMMMIGGCVAELLSMATDGDEAKMQRVVRQAQERADVPMLAMLVEFLRVWLESQRAQSANGELDFDEPPPLPQR